MASAPNQAHHDTYNLGNTRKPSTSTELPAFIMRFNSFMQLKTRYPLWQSQPGSTQMLVSSRPTSSGRTNGDEPICRHIDRRIDACNLNNLAKYTDSKQPGRPPKTKVTEVIQYVRVRRPTCTGIRGSVLLALNDSITRNVSYA